jgi:Trk-type K+ transport system membrane component
MLTSNGRVCSAYGNVGLSLGYSCQQWVRASANTPHAQAAAACRDAGYSFSGKWRAGSKLVLVGVMLAGRHRSLPDDMDCAISIAPTSSLCSGGKSFNPLQ